MVHFGDHLRYCTVPFLSKMGYIRVRAGVGPRGETSPNEIVANPCGVKTLILKSGQFDLQAIAFLFLWVPRVLFSVSEIQLLICSFWPFAY